MVGGAALAFVQPSVGILPLKTSRWVVRCGQRNEGSKRDDGTVDRHAVVSETRVASEANLPQQ